MDDSLLRIALVPLAVSFALKVTERFGHVTGGVVSGVPIVAGPIVYALAIEHGSAYGISAAAGALRGCIALNAFTWIYSELSRSHHWPFVLISGLIAFGAVTSMNAVIAAPNGASFITSIVASMLVYKRLVDLGERIDVWPRSKLLAPAVSALALAAIVVLGSHRLDASLSGALASFPVVTSVLAVHAHRSASAAAARQLLKGLSVGLICYACFFLALGPLLERFATTRAFVLASLLAICAHLLITRVLMRYFRLYD